MSEVEAAKVDLGNRVGGFGLAGRGWWHLRGRSVRRSERSSESEWTEGAQERVRRSFAIATTAAHGLGHSKGAIASYGCLFATGRQAPPSPGATMPSLAQSPVLIAQETLVTKRPAESANGAPTAKKSRMEVDTANPLGLKPLGNLLWAPQHGRTRAEGLGRLGMLPDELLLSSVFSLLEGEDLVRMSGASKAFYAWSCVEGMWKGLYIEVRTALSAFEPVYGTF